MGKDLTKPGLKYSMCTADGEEVVIPFLTTSRLIGGKSTVTVADGVTEISLINVLIDRLKHRNNDTPSANIVNAMDSLRSAVDSLSVLYEKG